MPNHYPMKRRVDTAGRSRQKPSGTFAGQEARWFSRVLRAMQVIHAGPRRIARKPASRRAGAAEQGRMPAVILLAAIAVPGAVIGAGPITQADQPITGETDDAGTREHFDCARQPLPILFDGLGLEGFAGRSSIARVLQAAEPDRASSPAMPFDLGMSVAGPGSRGGARPLKLQADVAAPGPLQAVVRSRVSGLDLLAGVDASPDSLQSGPARWMGGIGIQEEGPFGRAELALRTSMRYADTERLIRVEVGPRFERTLGRGVTFFLDGRAEAETAPSMAEPVATLPGMIGSQGLGFVGVTGRTGLVR